MNNFYKAHRRVFAALLVGSYSVSELAHLLGMFEAQVGGVLAGAMASMSALYADRAFSGTDSLRSAFPYDPDVVLFQEGEQALQIQSIRTMMDCAWGQWPQSLVQLCLSEIASGLMVRYAEDVFWDDMERYKAGVRIALAYQCQLLERLECLGAESDAPGPDSDLLIEMTRLRNDHFPTQSIGSPIDITMMVARPEQEMRWLRSLICNAIWVLPHQKTPHMHFHYLLHLMWPKQQQDWLVQVVQEMVILWQTCGPRGATLHLLGKNPLG